MDVEMTVKKARTGDKDALVQLIMEQKQDYYKLAYVYMQNQEDALDAMEDMIVVLYESIGRLKKPEAFYSWSKTVLVNCCKKHLRKKKKLLYLDTVKEAGAEDAIAQKNEELMLEKHLGQLDFKYREVLQLRYYLDLDYQSIADTMQIPVGTVKSRINTGLKKLKESIGGEGIEGSCRNAE